MPTLLELGAKAVGTALKDIGKGIRAYHSSPHDFDKFDLSKIGTGEGHQSYGRGLYFSDNPAVSGQGGAYWHQFKEHFLGPESEAADYLARAQFNRQHALQRVLEDQARIRASQATTYSPDLPESNWWHPSNADKLQAVADLLKTDKPVGPRTYEVNINAKPEQLLDWNKPLQAQPEGIQRLVQDNPRLGGNDMVRGQLVSPSGENIYRRLQAGKGDAAPKVLDAYGVPGLKYLDQGSRKPTFDPALDIYGAPTRDGVYITNAKGGGYFPSHDDAVKELEKRFPQSSNYAIWRDDLVDILKKYGIGAAVPAAGTLRGNDADAR
jgi:hypothetical protein